MDVVLLRAVPKVGKAGDTKAVAEGYARNYLLPRGLAAPATPDRLAWARAEQARRSRPAGLSPRDQQRFRAALDGRRLTVPVRANEQGTLFGAVTAEALSAMLKAEGFPVDPSMIHLPFPLKRLGEYRGVVAFSDQGRATLTVTVIPSTS